MEIQKYNFGRRWLVGSYAVLETILSASDQHNIFVLCLIELGLLVPTPILKIWNIKQIPPTQMFCFRTLSINGNSVKLVAEHIASFTRS